MGTSAVTGAKQEVWPGRDLMHGKPEKLSFVSGIWIANIKCKDFFD